MDVFDLFAKINLDTSEYENGLSGASKRTSNFGKSLKSGLAAAAKISATAIAAAGTAVGALGKAALDGYANYEQLAGGVETLFKDSYLTVMGYADRAFLTAGLSANAYMETVTSFSASLLQSLGGDTEKAAKIADLAIIDMSDNANKMGTAMESIQNAYQGFAKQNYTMLDNLKLGYGGTKEEMARLLADAEKISGIEYDLSSYSDIVQAIHVIQTEMDITGTTAKEASTTIQGSLASAKASWENLLTAVAAGEELDFTAYLNNFVDSVKTAADNILPRFSQILGGIGKLVEGLAPIVAEEAPTIIGEVLPSLLDAAILLINNLLDGVLSALPTLMEKLTPMALMLVDTLLGMLPQILLVSVQLVDTLARGIADAAPTLIPAAISAVIELCNALLSPEGLSAILNAALALLHGLADGILTSLPILTEAAPEIVGQLAATIIQFIPELMPVAYEIIWALIQGMWDTMPDLLSNTADMLGELWDAIVKVDWVGLGIDVMTTVALGILSVAGKIRDCMQGAFSSGIEWIKQLISEAPTWGRDMIQGLVDGIRNMIGKVKSAVRDVANAIRSFLHFSRPDVGPMRDYEQWMPDMIEGLTKGIKANQYKLRSAAEDLAADLGAVSPSAMGNVRAAVGGDTFTINVYGAAGQSIDELADAVSMRIQNLINRKDAVFA